ncbi:hypothetical protein ABPG74_007411 [Tetrahymena malaccensis]
MSCNLFAKGLSKLRFSTKKERILLGALDQSTTGTKFVVFDSLGNQIQQDMIPHDQITQKPGWLEHNAEQILENANKAIQNTVRKLEQDGFSVSQIKSIGVTNQRETVVAWNKQTGKPYNNALVWSDTRTREICKKYLEKNNGNANHYSKITGLPINTYFSSYKIRWLIENVPQIRQDLFKDVVFGTMDSWLVWNLTKGNHFTDVTNASRTSLLNIKNLKYEKSILNDFEIPEETLPKVLSSSQEFGIIQDGPLKGIPIAACLGDQQAASVGHGLFNLGDSKNTYGTGCFFLVNTGTEPRFVEGGGLLTTILYKLGKDEPTVYGFEGSIEAGGSSINWARDNMGLYKDFHDLKDLIDKTKDTQGVYFVPAFSGLFSPFWREDAAGCILGLTMHSKREHILRALLEGIAYRTRDVVEAFEATAGKKIDSLKIDGGLSKNKFLMQFQADILQKDIYQTKVVDSTCLGVAFAAGLSSNVYKDVEELKQYIEIETKVSYNPQFSNQAEEQYKKWKKAIQRSMDWKD